MVPGLGALGEAELSKALGQICLAEGVVRSNLVSVKIIDGEISVRYVRSNGCNRTSISDRRSVASYHWRRSS